MPSPSYDEARGRLSVAKPGSSPPLCPTGRRL